MSGVFFPRILTGQIQFCTMKQWPIPHGPHWTVHIPRHDTNRSQKNISKILFRIVWWYIPYFIPKNFWKSLILWLIVWSIPLFFLANKIYLWNGWFISPYRWRTSPSLLVLSIIRLESGCMFNQKARIAIFISIPINLQHRFTIGYTPLWLGWCVTNGMLHYWLIHSKYWVPWFTMIYL